MAGKDIEIGSAYVEFEARVSGAESELDRLGERAETTASRVEGSANRVGGAFERAGPRVRTGTTNAGTGVDSLAVKVDKLGDGAAQTTTQLKGMGDAATTAGAKSKAASGGLASGLKQADNAATKLQSGLSKLLIPVAVVAAVKGIVDNFRAAQDETKNLKRAFQEIGDAAEDAADRAARSGIIPESIIAQQDIMKEAQARADEIQKQLDDFLKKTGTAFGEFKQFAIGQSRQSVVDEANKEIEAIFAAARKQTTAQRKASEREIVSDAKELAKGLQEQSLDGIQRLEAEESAALLRVAELRKESNTDATDRQLDESRRAIREEFAARRYAMVEASLLEKRLAKEREQDQLAAIEKRAQTLERSLMEAHQQEKLRLEDERLLVSAQIFELRKGGIDKAAGEDRALEALQRIERVLISQQKEAADMARDKAKEDKRMNDEQGGILRRAISDGMADTLARNGLLTIPQTLGAINENQRELVREMGRIGG